MSSSLLSQLIYGSNSDDDNETSYVDPGTDAQPLFSPAPPPIMPPLQRYQQDDESIINNNPSTTTNNANDDDDDEYGSDFGEEHQQKASYLDLLRYDDDDDEDEDEDNDDDDDHRQSILAQFSQEDSAPSPQQQQQQQQPKQQQLLQNTTMSSSLTQQEIERASYISQMIHGEKEEDNGVAAKVNADPNRQHDSSYFEEEEGDPSGDIIQSTTRDTTTTTNNNNTTTRKRKRQEHDDDDDDEILEEENNVNEIAANILNALYGNSNNTQEQLLDPTEKKISSSSSTHQQGLPNNIINNNKTTIFENPFLTAMRAVQDGSESSDDDDEEKKKQEQDDDDDDNDDELLLLKELKEMKLKRHAEWRSFRARWKRRKIDLNDENDIGDGYLQRARQFLLPKLLLEQQQQQQQQQKLEKEKAEAKAARKQQQQEEEEQQYYYDSSEEEVDEQMDSLQRLSQSIEEQEKRQALELDPIYQKRKKRLKALEEAKKPYATTMDYWQQGYTDPTLKDLDDFYYPRDYVNVKVGNVVTASASSSSTTTTTAEKVSSLSSSSLKKLNNTSTTTNSIILKKQVPYPERDPNTYYHFPLHHRRLAGTSFIHNRQLFRIAARCIMKTTRMAAEHHHNHHHQQQQQQNVVMNEQDRFLRMLWQPDHEKFTRSYLHLYQTQEYGENMVTFLNHKWKNSNARKVVAKRLLGISCGGGGGTTTNSIDEFHPPMGLMGYTMETDKVHTVCTKERKRLVKRYSLQKMPTASDAGDGGGGDGGKQKSMTLSKKSKRLHQQQQSSSIILPTVGYIHLPGTTPPVPTFPLDETNVIFGPADRHIMFRHVGGIDETTCKLTLSSMVNRLATLQQRSEESVAAAARVRNDHQDDDHLMLSDEPPPLEDYSDYSEEIRRLQEQLFAFIEKAPLQAKNDLFKRFRQIDPKIEIPLVQFYRSMMTFCNFAVSGCPQPKVYEIDSKEDDSGSDNNPYNLLKVDMSDDEGEASEIGQEGMDVSVLTMDEAAKKICDFCDPLIMHNGLKAFPRIHLTYGLATIVRLFPASGAELLSAPSDQEENRTPFDAFRRTLEHLEEQALLIEDNQVNEWACGEDLVRVGELEFALHRAVEIFGLCIQRYPIEVKYHEWRLAALGASLILCSGHKVGSKALPFPSSHYVNRDGTNNNQIYTSELRKTLEKFNEVRRATMDAFKLLIQLSQRQESSTRAHLAIASFWEWKQMIALVVGQGCMNPARMKAIRENHLYHSVQWALQAKSVLALKYLDILSGSEGFNSDVRLKKMVASIERDPNDVKNWRSLVAALGPLGYRISQVHHRSCCDASRCVECQLLREGYAADHYALDARKKAGDWWGKDVIDWWYPHYLSTSLQVPDKSKTQQLMKKLENTIHVGLIDTDDNLIESTGYLLQSTSQSMSASPGSLDWLWSGAEDKGDIIYQEEEDNVHDLLPNSFATVIRNETKPNSVAPVANMQPDFEAIYLKLVVTCHLFGVAHPHSLELVCELCRRSVKGKVQKVDTSSQEWRCLLEISRLGVDVLKVLDHYRTRVCTQHESARAKRPAKPRFTESQRQAVRDGLDRFGCGKWKEMSQHYEVLNGLSRFVILDIYKWLQKYEGMGDRRSEKSNKRTKGVTKAADYQQAGEDSTAK